MQQFIYIIQTTVPIFSVDVTSGLLKVYLAIFKTHESFCHTQEFPQNFEWILY